jgi:cytidine deaminase
MVRAFKIIKYVFYYNSAIYIYLYMAKKDGKNRLVSAAIKAMKNSHSPHSKFKVGAALEGKSGEIYQGTNIEFDAYTLTVCAERAALFNAISNGEKGFKALAIATSSDEFKYPCGLCRQALIEFNPKMKLLLITKKGKTKHVILKDILPKYFKL